MHFSPGVLLISALLVSGCAAGSRPGIVDGTNVTHSEISKLKCAGDEDKSHGSDKSEVDQHVVESTFIDDLVSEVRADPKDRKDIRQYVHDFLGEFQKFSAKKPAGKGKNNKLLIYINGGLNLIGGARKLAANQIRCMELDGYFPAYLNWRTEALLTYGEQISKVRNGKINRNLQVTTPLYLAADLGAGLARAPITFYNQTARYLDRLVFRDKIEYGVDVDGSVSRKHHYTKESGEVGYKSNVVYGERIDKQRSDFGGDILYTLTVPLRLVTTPFTDFLGKTAWKNMLRRSRVTVRSAWEFQPEFFDIKRTPAGKGALSRFFQELVWCREGRHGCNKNCIKPC